MALLPFAFDYDPVTGHSEYGVGLSQHGPGGLVLKVEFADLGGGAEHLGKVCFDAGLLPAGKFRTCTGTDHFCPKGPPPPNSPPPVVLDLTATEITADRIKFGLINEIHVFEGAPADVPDGLTSRLVPLGGGSPAYKSFHVYRVLEVIGTGGLAADGLVDKFLAVPVTGSGVTP